MRDDQRSIFNIDEVTHHGYDQQSTLLANLRQEAALDASELSFKGDPPGSTNKL